MRDGLFAAPKSPYTRALIDAIPLPRVDPGWLHRAAPAGGMPDGQVKILGFDRQQ